MLIPQRLAPRNGRRIVNVGTHHLLERDLEELRLGQPDVLEEDVEARRAPAFMLLDEPRRLASRQPPVPNVDAGQVRRSREPA